MGRTSKCSKETTPDKNQKSLHSYFSPQKAEITDNNSQIVTPPGLKPTARGFYKRLNGLQLASEAPSTTSSSIETGQTLGNVTSSSDNMGVLSHGIASNYNVADIVPTRKRTARGIRIILPNSHQPQLGNDIESASNNSTVTSLINSAPTQCNNMGVSSHGIASNNNVGDIVPTRKRTARGIRNSLTNFHQQSGNDIESASNNSTVTSLINSEPTQYNNLDITDYENNAPIIRKPTARQFAKRLRNLHSTESNCDNESPANSSRANEAIITNASAQASNDESNDMKVMKISIVNTVHTIMKLNLVEQAINFLCMMPMHLPPQELLHTILFDVLLEVKDQDITLKTSLYTLQLVDKYPPNTNKKALYYKKAIFETKEKQNDSMFGILSNLVLCCFQKCCIKADRGSFEPCGKNCMELLNFIVVVMSKNNEAFLDSNANKMSIHLLSDMIWPLNNNARCSSILLQTFTSYVDTSFSSERLSGTEIQLAEFLTGLLNIATDYVLHFAGINEAEILYRPIDFAIMHILRYIRDIAAIQFEVAKLEVFLLLIKQPWIRIFICLNILNRILYCNWREIDNPLSLRKIMDHFLTPTHEAMEEDLQTSHDTDDNSNGCTVEKKIVGTTLLHEACRKNRPGTLLRYLSQSDSCVNAVDERLNTALHVACKEKSYLCARILLHKSTKEADVLAKDREGNTPLHISSSNNDWDISKLLLDVGADVFAIDRGGNTPLHISSFNNDLNISKLLLDVGGEQLATTKNGHGELAHKLAENQDVKQLIKQCFKTKRTYRNTLNKKPTSESQQNPTLASVCKSSECAMYVFCLLMILTEYINFFKLSELKRSSCLTDEELCKHLQRNFNYAAKAHSIDTLGDDIVMLRRLPDDIHKFVEFLKATRQPISDVEHLLDDLTFFADTL